MATVTAPVDGYTGRVAGVHFVDGKAETTDRRALAYFRRQGYSIDRSSGSAPANPQTATVDIIPSTARVPAVPVLPAKPTVKDLKAYAAAVGIDLQGATRKDDILAAIAAVEPASVDPSDPGPGAAVVEVGEVAVEAGDEAATVSWIPSGPTVGFEVESIEADGDAEAELDPCTESPFEVLDLANDVAYRFRVRAVTEAGPGPWSEPVTATPSAADEDDHVDAGDGNDDGE